VDKEILDNLLNQRVLLINDENFVLTGKINAVYEDTVAFVTDGKIRYLRFDRIKEIRPLGESNE